MRLDKTPRFRREIESRMSLLVFDDQWATAQPFIEYYVTRQEWGIEDKDAVEALVQAWVAELGLEQCLKRIPVEGVLNIGLCDGGFPWLQSSKAPVPSQEMLIRMVKSFATLKNDGGKISVKLVQRPLDE